MLDGGSEDDDGLLVEPFDTPNPWLTQLFEDPQFDAVPPEAPYALGAVSADPEERLFSAVDCTHGRMRSGMLLATTKLLRWVDIGSRLGHLTSSRRIRNETYWSYDCVVEVQHELTNWYLTVEGGAYFLTSKRQAQAFARHYRMIQQAVLWDLDHEDEQPAAQNAFTTSSDVAERLERLGNMYTQGLLTPDEFAAAKARLLSS